mgnify:CR=1 FL=1
MEAMQGRWPTGLDAAAGGPEKYGSRAARMRRINPKHTLRQVGHVAGRWRGPGWHRAGVAPCRGR